MTTTPLPPLSVPPAAWLTAALAGFVIPALALLVLDGARGAAGPVLAVGLMGAGMIAGAIAGRLWTGVALALLAGAGLTVLALGLCAALAVIQGALSGDWPQALLAALALALAVLPNEIPVVLALFLALGALRLARIGVLARWPAAVESLGSATVLAVDKTGTLTENRMGVQQLLTWPQLEGWQAGETLEEPVHQLLELAVLASRGDPVDAMELAIQRLAADHLGGTEHLHPDWPLERDYPLQSDLLVFSRLWHDGDGGLRLAAKGAPEAIADLCRDS
jgi:Ca2+-transporting ATPase